MSELPAKSHIHAKKLEDLDGQIEELKRQTVQLQRHRNSFTPVFSIPPEILGQIFSFHVVDGLSERSPRCPWINILHVCYEWRAIAFATPSIWMTPDFRYPKLSMEMLKHSHESVLDLEVTTIGDDITSNTPQGIRRRVEALGQALEHISRVRRLDFCTDNNSLENLVPKLIQPAPALQYLSIRGVKHRASLNDFVSLPSDFLGNGHAPLLRELRLVGCCLPWSSDLLQNLRVLDLQYGGAGDFVDECPSNQQLMLALARMPGIEVLELRDCLPLESAEPYKQTILLPRLRYLKLTADGEACADLLDCISFPNTTRINIRCEVDVERSHLFSSLTKFFHSDRKIASMFVGLNDSFMDEDFELLTWNTEVDWREFFLDEATQLSDGFHLGDVDYGQSILPDEELEEVFHPPVSPDLYLRVLPDHPIPVLLQALHCLPVSTLCFLHLSEWALSSEQLLVHFGHLPNLRTIFISHFFPFALFEAFSADPESFKALRILGLKNVVFSQDFHGSLIAIQHRQPLDILLDCLGGRSRTQEVRLEALVIRDCVDLNKDDVEKITNRLRETVEVDWDEMEYVGESD